MDIISSDSIHLIKYYTTTIRNLICCVACGFCSPRNISSPRVKRLRGVWSNGGPLENIEKREWDKFIWWERKVVCLEWKEWMRVGERVMHNAVSENEVSGSYSQDVCRRIKFLHCINEPTYIHIIGKWDLDWEFTLKW